MSIIDKSDNPIKVRNDHSIPLDMINEILKLERLCWMSDHLKLFKKKLRDIESGYEIILIDQD